MWYKANITWQIQTAKGLFKKCHTVENINIDVCDSIEKNHGCHDKHSNKLNNFSFFSLCGFWQYCECTKKTTILICVCCIFTTSKNTAINLQKYMVNHWRQFMVPLINPPSLSAAASVQINMYTSQWPENNNRIEFHHLKRQYSHFMSTLWKRYHFTGGFLVKQGSFFPFSFPFPPGFDNHKSFPQRILQLSQEK